MISRRSWGGLFLHFMHAQSLPKDLPVSHYVPDKGVPFSLLFQGHVEQTVGDVEPPPVHGFIDWGVLLFWLTYCLGFIQLGEWVFSLLKWMMGLFLPFL